MITLDNYCGSVYMNDNILEINRLLPWYIKYNTPKNISKNILPKSTCIIFRYLNFLIIFGASNSTAITYSPIYGKNNTK